MYDLESRINQAVFPGLQGGPHNHAIAAIATAMKQVKTPEFRAYQKQIILNAKRLCVGLQNHGYKISTGGTDVHMLLVDLRPFGITGSKAEKILEEISIACNKNTTPGDKSALNPGGIRLGTPALTTRGFKEEDIDKVVDFIHKGELILCSYLNENLVSSNHIIIWLNLYIYVYICLYFLGLLLSKEITKISGPKLADFKHVLETNADIKAEIAALKEEVENFSLQFPIPGIEQY